MSLAAGQKQTESEDDEALLDDLINVNDGYTEIEQEPGYEKEEEEGGQLYQSLADYLLNDHDQNGDLEDSINEEDDEVDEPSDETEIFSDESEKDPQLRRRCWRVCRWVRVRRCRPRRCRRPSGFCPRRCRRRGFERIRRCRIVCRPPPTRPTRPTPKPTTPMTTTPAATTPVGTTTEGTTPAGTTTAGTTPAGTTTSGTTPSGTTPAGTTTARP